MQLKNLSYALWFVTHQYKTQWMCDKTKLENGRKLKSVSDCYKNQ